MRLRFLRTLPRPPCPPLSLHDALPIFASAVFVVTANAWMNAPLGYTLVANKVVAAQPVVAMLSTASGPQVVQDRKSTRLNTSHLGSSYAVFCLKKIKRIYTSTHICTHN